MDETEGIPVTDGQSSVDIVGLAKNLTDIGLYAITCIKSLKSLGKGKDVEKYIKEIDDKRARLKVLVASLVSYRLLNLYTTQLFDDTRDFFEKFYMMKEQNTRPKWICSSLEKELDGMIRYYKQNIAIFRTDSLDRSHASHIKDLIGRVGESLIAASTNLEDGKIKGAIDGHMKKLAKECISIRGETYFAIDRLADEFRNV